MADHTPDEQVYLDAIAAYHRVREEAYKKWQHKPLGDAPFRAAVLSAWRAGYGQGREEAAAGEDGPPIGWLPGADPATGKVATDGDH